MILIISALGFLSIVFVALWQHQVQRRIYWMRECFKAQEEFERIKTVSNRLRYGKPDLENVQNASQVLRPSSYVPNPTESKILTAGFEFSKGPDAYSLTILRQLTAWRDGGVFAPVAHYWPKSQWWNLIGLSQKGRGLDKCLEVLKHANRA